MALPTPKASMQSYQRLLLNNQAWVADKMSLRPDFFTRYSGGQKPEFLWIGCSDSRVPAEEVTGVGNGEGYLQIHGVGGSVPRAAGWPATRGERASSGLRTDHGAPRDCPGVRIEARCLQRYDRGKVL